MNWLTKTKYLLRAVIIGAIILTIGIVGEAKGDPIVNNDVEDINILISQFIGGQANALFIFGLPQSLELNYGGSQIGDWDEIDTIEACEKAFCGGQDCTDSSRTNIERAMTAHCAENVAGPPLVNGALQDSSCGTLFCRDGVCDTVAEFGDINNIDTGDGIDNFLECIKQKTGMPDIKPLHTQCVGLLPGSCNGACDEFQERAILAACIENKAGLTPCASAIDPNTGLANCNDGSKTDQCGAVEDYARVKACMQNVNRKGSSQLDVALGVFYDVIDIASTNSLPALRCTIPTGYKPEIDGATGIIKPECDPSDPINSDGKVSCQCFMFAPFGGDAPPTGASDVGLKVEKNSGSDAKLPTAGDKKLIDLLDSDDASGINIRLRTMTFAGAGTFNGCTQSSSFKEPLGGFSGGSTLGLDNFWKDVNDVEAGGGNPLALALGLDDDPIGGDISKDALNVFRVSLQTDQALSCRTNFVIVITDGKDTCSGDDTSCSDPTLVGSTNSDGGCTNNTNRINSIRAVNNLRYHFLNNPIDGEQKEVNVFVIGLGANDDKARRTVEAMALAGGTSQQGVADGAQGSSTGITADLVDSSISNPGTLNDIFVRDLSQNPSDKPTDTNLTSVFTDAYFDSGTGEFESFAFFANNREELVDAVQTIFDLIKGFGANIPGAPPSAPPIGSLALRDRIFLSILTPLQGQYFWQGREALYSFDRENKKIKDKDNTEIFESDGTLSDEHAPHFFWEAARKLTALPDPATRNIFTTDLTGSQVITEGSTIMGFRDTGTRAVFNTTTSSLTPDFFGISDSDVSSIETVIPECSRTAPGSCSTDAACVTDPNSTSCLDCVKTCARDKIVTFFRGCTEILPNFTKDKLGSFSLITDIDGYFNNCSVTPPPLDSPLRGDFRGWVRFGDPFHSTPTIAGSPSFLFFDEGFQQFADFFRERTAVTYVGANDGVMHAFFAGNFCPGDFCQANPCDFDGDGENDGHLNPFEFDESGANVCELDPPLGRGFFDDGGTNGGEELFGFIPVSFVKPEVDLDTDGTPEEDLSGGGFKEFFLKPLPEQRSFIDAPPTVADIFLDGVPNGIDKEKDPSTGLCVDGSTTVTRDGFIDVCGKEWHTILMFGLRNGGRTYTALDVTNPPKPNGDLFIDISTNTDAPPFPKHLWTIYDVDFGNTWSEPTIGRVRFTDDNGAITDRWIMFVGGGLNFRPDCVKSTEDGGVYDVQNCTDGSGSPPTPDIRIGNAFYAVDIATGKIVWKYGGSDTKGSDVVDTRMQCDVPATPGVFDIDGDGYADLAYVGDTCGQLWRFDVSNPIEAATGSSITDADPDITAPNWTGDVAFCMNADLTDTPDCSDSPTESSPVLNPGQPIFFAPTFVFDSTGANKHVIFITGNRRDPTGAQKGRLVNFIDSFEPGGGSVSAKEEDSITRVFELKQIGTSAEFCITLEGSTTCIDPGTGSDQGEFIVEFASDDEKGIGAPVVISRLLLFSTFSPEDIVLDPCASEGGSGRVFAIDFLTAEPTLTRILSVSDAEVAGKEIALGLPTPARITYGARGAVLAIQAFSGGPGAGSGQFIIVELPAFPVRTQTLYWREVF